MAYDLRARKVKNYKEVANTEFCKISMRKRPREEKLYELEKDRQNRRVKVHYVGYESEYDEWRDKDVKIIYPVQGKLVFCSCLFVQATVPRSRKKNFGFGSLMIDEGGGGHREIWVH